MLLLRRSSVVGRIVLTILTVDRRAETSRQVRVLCTRKKLKTLHKSGMTEFVYVCGESW